MTGLLLVSSKADADTARICTATQPVKVNIPGFGLVDDSAKFWNKTTIKVKFLDGDATVQAKVIKWAQVWSQFANVIFAFGNDPSSDIKVSFLLKGQSWSYIGTDALSIPQSKPSMNLGWLDATTSDDVYSSVVLHEFGHVLGLIHEHQSPAAGIKWNKPAAYTYFAANDGWSNTQVDAQVFSVYSTPTSNYSAFDINSIMLYSFPASLTLDGSSTPWNTTLSSMDKEYIGIIYAKNIPIYVGNVVSNVGYYWAVNVGRFDKLGTQFWDTKPSGYVFLGHEFNPQGFWLAVHPDFKDRTFYVGVVRSNVGTLYQVKSGSPPVNLGNKFWDEGPVMNIGKYLDVNGFWVKMQ